MDYILSFFIYGVVIIGAVGIKPAISFLNTKIESTLKYDEQQVTGNEVLIVERGPNELKLDDVAKNHTSS